MEFEEHVDQEEEMEGYETLMAANSSSSGRPTSKMGEELGPRKPIPRYRECLKNHAVGLGGHAVDGCGEFMAAGEEGSIDALKCAACGCHRNFHRKEAPSGHFAGAMYSHASVPLPPQFSSYYRGVPPPAGYLPLTRPLAITAGPGDVDEDVSNPSSSGGGGSSSRKRFRTKFTQEQKDKMLEFAERLGWRIQKNDDATVESFCLETGVKRHVLKVWMHNNRNTVGKKP